jgi:hypothetical protein
MTTKEFDDFYSGDPDFNWDGSEGCEGRMETFEPHVSRVAERSRIRPRTVWTIVDGDDGEMYVLPGFHLVNRVLYFVSNEEWESEEEYYIW